jgi:hypothetical protein
VGDVTGDPDASGEVPLGGGALVDDAQAARMSPIRIVVASRRREHAIGDASLNVPIRR